MKSNPTLIEQCEVQELDDILFTRLRGDYTLELAVKLQTLTNALATRFGYRLLLLDVRRLGSISPAARRYLVEDQQRERVDGAVGIVGASFAMRTLSTMIIRAISKLSNTPISLEFFDSEEHATAWLQRERNRLRTIIASKNVP